MSRLQAELSHYRAIQPGPTPTQFWRNWQSTGAMNSQQMMMMQQHQQQMEKDVYAPGTRLTVGSHQIVINKYFSKGGFAQVYTCNITPAWNGRTLACLKRVMVPDKSSLGILRKEVDAMRKLQGIHCIVSYIDSHATRSHNGNGPGYEVFMLMEYCSGKGLIDFMNTRLVEKLKESEILLIMQQVTEAVAHMHALSPPLVHRDIKIENVLIGDDGTFKLCDFGSVSNPIMPPKNIEEFQIVQDDIMKNTTPQYRAPEMLDLYKNEPIDGKSDVWALGIMLYKLCYFTTPFEQNAINGNQNGYSGDYAILNGIYNIPHQPPYSARLKNVIAKILVVDPKKRPNVNLLLDEICKMRGKPTPIIKKSVPNSISLAIPQQLTPNYNQSLSQNNSVSAFNSMVNVANMANTGNSINASKPMSTASSINSSVTGVANNYSGRSSNFKYSNLQKSITNTVSDPFEERDPQANMVKKFGNVQLSPVKTRSTLPNRRPLSQYGTADMQRRNLNSGTDTDNLSIQNFINDITTEEVVNLSSSTGKKQSSITSSIEYIKSLSRQNTSNQNAQHTGTRSTSKSKKRNSITSLKNLLTGGSTKGSTTGGNEPQLERTNSKRNSSLYASKRNSSIDSLPDTQQKYKALNSSLADLKEMSPEGKMPSRFPDQKSMDLPKIKNLADSIPDVGYDAPHAVKRSNSIQTRIKTFMRSQSPPLIKTAQGYGKYTESDPSLLPSSPSISSSRSIKSTKSGRSVKSVKSSKSSSSSSSSASASSVPLPKFPTMQPAQIVESNAKPPPPKQIRSVQKAENPFPSMMKHKSSTEPVSILQQDNMKSKSFDKRKPPPPPRPSKPAHLKLNSGYNVASRSKTVSGADDSFDTDDLDALEKRFERKFPGVA